MTQPVTNTPTICRWVVNRALELTELHEDLVALFDLDTSVTTPQNALITFFEKVHPEDAPALHRFWTTSADQFPTSQEFRYLLRDGTIKWLRSILIMKLENGSVLGTTHDISEARFQAKENEEIKAQLEKITRTSPSIIYVYDLALKQNAYVNRSLYDALGYSQQDIAVLGDQFFPTTIHPDDLPKVLTHLSDILPFLKEGKSVKLEYRIKNKNTGEYVWLKSTEAPYSFDEEGRVTSIIGVTDDITTEKEAINEVFQLNKELSKKNARLEKIQLLLKDAEAVKKLNHKLTLSQKKLNLLNQEMEEFVYITSHDLSEPLRTVSNFLGLILKRKQVLLDDEAMDYLTRVLGANTRMKGLVNALLSLSKVGEEVSSEQVVLGKLILEVLEDLHQVIEESHTKVEIQALPIVSGNPSDFKRLFQNLLSNSIKYRKEGIYPSITIKSVEKRDHWIILVSDNGIGMDPKYSNKIFQPFQRLHLASEYEGTGIGLAICRKVAMRYGGEIWVETEPGKGSVFFIKLPK